MAPRRPVAEAVMEAVEERGEGAVVVAGLDHTTRAQKKDIAREEGIRPSAACPLPRH